MADRRPFIKSDSERAEDYRVSLVDVYGETDNEYK